MSCFLDAAIRYAGANLPVHALAPGTKIPSRGSHGYKDATTDLALVRAIWTKTPDANIGIATGAKSGIFVVDVDMQHDGPASLTALERQNGALPLTVQSGTPNGGSHYYFRWPGGIEIRNSVSRVGAGIDIRGERGSIVAPPSVLADGRRYAWFKNGAHAFADAPQWLIDAALPPPRPKVDPRPISGSVSHYVSAAVADELTTLDRAGPGTRNHALNKAAFALFGFVRAGQLHDDWARAQLESHAMALGLSPSEIGATLVSAYASARPREMPNG